MIDRNRIGFLMGLLAAASVVAPPAVGQAIPDALDRAAAAFVAGLAADQARAASRPGAQQRTAERELARATMVLERIGVHTKGSDLVLDWRRTLPASDAGPLRGRGLGPGYQQARLAPAEVYRQQQIFIGGELARVVVAPAPRTALSLQVSDRNGQVLCRTLVETRPGECSWTPVFTSRHTFEVKAVKDAASQFVVLTN